MTDTIDLQAPRVNEGAPMKARRYLLEGRLRIETGAEISAVCRGDGESYLLGFRAGSWYCTCPARTNQCAHLRALRLVVDRPSE